MNAQIRHHTGPLEPGLVALLLLLFILNATPQPAPGPGTPTANALTNTALLTNAPALTNATLTNAVPITNTTAARIEAIRAARAAAVRAAPPAFTAAPLPVPNQPAQLNPGAQPLGAQGAVPADEPGLLATNPSQTPLTTQGADTTILRFKNAPLEQIFDMYSQLTGRVVLYPTQLQTQAITITSSEINLTTTEAVHAIEGALSLNGVTLIPLGERFVKAVPAAQSIQEGPPINQGPVADLPEAEQFITQVVPLKVVPPSEVAAVFGSFSKTPGGIIPIDASMILVLRDYASNIKRMMELIQQIDVQPESAYVLEVVPIKYGKVSDFFETMNSLIGGAGAGGVSGMPVTGTGSRAGTTGVGSRSLGTGGRTLGTTGRAGSSSSRYSQNQSALQRGGVQSQQAGLNTPGVTQGGANTTFQQRLQQIVSRAAGDDQIELLSDARIVPDERSNSLIVYANRQDMVMITNIVAKVDVLLAQVLIEGIVLAVNVSDRQDIGVNWLQKPRQFGDDFAGAGVINNGLGFLSGAITNFPSGQPTGFSYLGSIGQDFEVAIRAFASDGRVRILQRPRVQTSHAVPGYFFSGSTVPYVTGFTDYGFGTSVGTRSQVEQVEVGVRLEVIPYITPDGLVVLDIFQDISQLGEFVQIDQNEVPTTTSRNAQATLSVRDGDTIILGGYIEETRNSGKSGVPVLKDLPLLGALFRSKTENNSRTELILLMHVTILKNPADAGVQADTEKSKLPGISAAEEEFLKSDQKKHSF